jgi:hypothetical protein
MREVTNVFFIHWGIKEAFLQTWSILTGCLQIRTNHELSAIRLPRTILLGKKQIHQDWQVIGAHEGTQVCRPAFRSTTCFSTMNLTITVLDISHKKTPWPESTSELYQPSDRCLSAKLVPTFADRGVSRSQRPGSPTAVISISRPESLLFLSSSSSIVLEWTLFQAHHFSENLVAPGIEPELLDL